MMRGSKVNFREMATKARDRAEQCDQKAKRAHDPDARQFLREAAISWRDIAKHYLRLAGEYRIT